MSFRGVFAVAAALWVALLGSCSKSDPENFSRPSTKATASDRSGPTQVGTEEDAVKAVQDIPTVPQFFRARTRTKGIDLFWQNDNDESFIILDAKESENAEWYSVVSKDREYKEESYTFVREGLKSLDEIRFRLRFFNQNGTSASAVVIVNPRQELFPLSQFEQRPVERRVLRAYVDPNKTNQLVVEFDDVIQLIDRTNLKLVGGPTEIVGVIGNGMGNKVRFALSDHALPQQSYALILQSRTSHFATETSRVELSENIIVVDAFEGEYRGESKLIYVSSSSEAQESNGDLATPFRTVSDALEVAIPGDYILLKRGDEFQGPLVFDKSGTPSDPIRVSSYGEIANERASEELFPVIVFNGEFGQEQPRFKGQLIPYSAVSIRASYVHLHNLFIKVVASLPADGVQLLEGKGIKLSGLQIHGEDLIASDNFIGPSYGIRLAYPFLDPEGEYKGPTSNVDVISNQISGLWSKAMIGSGMENPNQRLISVPELTIVYNQLQETLFFQDQAPINDALRFGPAIGLAGGSYTGAYVAFNAVQRFRENAIELYGVDGLLLESNFFSDPSSESRVNNVALYSKNSSFESKRNVFLFLGDTPVAPFFLKEMRGFLSESDAIFQTGLTPLSIGSESSTAALSFQNACFLESSELQLQVTGSSMVSVQDSVLAGALNFASAESRSKVQFANNIIFHEGTSEFGTTELYEDVYDIQSRFSLELAPNSPALNAALSSDAALKGVFGLYSEGSPNIGCSQSFPSN